MAGESPASFFLMELIMFSVKPIMSGMFGPISVNNRFRLLADKINDLEVEISRLKGEKVHTPAVNDYNKDDSEEPETTTLETATQESDTEFNIDACEDPAQLKTYAFSQYGLTITGNKKAETIRKEIRASI